MDNTNEDLPLHAGVEDGLLTIQIGVKTLAFACEHRDEPPQIHVSDPYQFAKDVLIAMEREEEDGSSHLTRFLDRMMQEAIDQGSFGVDFPEDEEELDVEVEE